MARLLLVSNRLPVTVTAGDNGIAVERSSGGLATGLRGPHERSGGLWIGWPGNMNGLDATRRSELGARLRDLGTVPIELTPEEVHGYYEVFSNGVLWPLFHYLVDRVNLDNWHFSTYQRVNERFADQVADEYRPGDLIWVHDYHLALLPALLRARLPDARIAFFLHIPFPSSEVLRLLPWREEVLEGLLGADLIGFHTLTYVRHFTSSLLAIVGIEAEVDRVQYGGRVVRLGAFPMGIDAARFDANARTAAIVARAEAIRQEAGDRRILLGVDRLDYTKGIPRRLLALERLLLQQPELASTIRLIQVTVPSRSGTETYGEFRRQLDEIVGRINGAFATPDAVVIHYMYRAIDEAELVAMYRAADVLLVTSLRDGMNLVAKEFVASRSDEDGVLVLSEFAGAASELGEALRINPYDIDRTAATILRALTMPARERRVRMRALRERVAAGDIHRWADSFIEALAATHDGDASCLARSSAPEVIDALVERLRRAERLLVLLDYDGTLVPFMDTPEQAAPDAELLAMLTALASRPGTNVHLLSGRTREDLETWFGKLPLGLHAEHGFSSRFDPASEWETVRPISMAWKEKVGVILDQFVARTPGAWIEEKTASLAWHYRLAQPGFGRRQASELRHCLHDLLANLPVHVLQGEKVVEVRLFGIHKGIAAQRIVLERPVDAILAVGDDSTDDDMFEALPASSINVRVGPRASRARYQLADVNAVRDFLRRLTPRSG